MNISLITVFPELYNVFLKTSLIGRAQEKELVSFNINSFFDFVEPKERIDSPTFGPGSGMLLRPDLIEKFVNKAEKSYGPAFKIFFSPQGKKLDQSLLKFIAQKAQTTNHLMVVPARYEGMDARVEEEYADLVISLGDYVLMAGDLPAMIVIEGMLRLIPGVVGKQESVEHESFSGPFVDYPEYTAPVIWKGKEVPTLIRSGNHEKIRQWREEKAAEKTVMHHFEWLRSYPLTPEQQEKAQQFIPPHYCVLMHDEIMLPDNQNGTTSITSLDIHDIARSACAFGIKEYFIVTPLLDQQKIAQRLLDFWKTDVGIEYNKHRHEAVSKVSVKSSLDEVIKAIYAQEEKQPLLIATSARKNEQGAPSITYYDQERVWQERKPVLFIFGTGRGLAASIINRCDYLLLPLEGFSHFNHLSVRSAAALIFDRWLGKKRKETYSLNIFPYLLAMSVN